MPDWPLADGGRSENAGASTATSRGTSVTANASANTKGTSYTQLLASTAFDATAMLVMFDDIAAGVDYLVDIGVGAAASEVVLFPDLYCGGGTGSIVYGAQYLFPCAIPAGTRISARCQASTGSSAIRVSCLLFGGGFQPSQPLQRVTAYGVNAADSGGVSIDPGGSANTLPASYTQIVASTTNPICALIVAIGNQNNTTRSSQSWLVNIAIGAAASEQVIISNYALNCSTSPDIVVPQTSQLLPICIPAGTRLSARAQSDGIDATDRLFDLMIYGVD